MPYIPSEKTTKLDFAAKKGIFVGYDETSKVNRIYILAWRQTMVRWDVRFEEDRAFRKSREYEQGDQQVSPPQVSTS